MVDVARSLNSQNCCEAEGCVISTAVPEGGLRVHPHSIFRVFRIVCVFKSTVPVCPSPLNPTFCIGEH